MPPKKAKRGKGFDKEAAANRILELQRKLDETETALEEERKTREKMSRDKAGLLHQLATLEQTLAKQHERPLTMVFWRPRSRARSLHV